MGWIAGPVISDAEGNLLSALELDSVMKDLLEEVFDERKELFPPDIKEKEDIADAYHCFRSFRRASDTRAIEKKVAKTDIEIVNRWGKEESSKMGSKVVMPMRQHYAQPELLIGPFVRYTRAM